MEQWMLSHHGATIAEILAIWLGIQKLLTAVQDAIDAEPRDLKPPFGRVLYYMQAISSYAIAGNRVQPIQKTGA